MRTFSNYSALQSHITRSHSKFDIPDISLFGSDVEPSSPDATNENPDNFLPDAMAGDTMDGNDGGALDDE